MSDPSPARTDTSDSFDEVGRVDRPQTPQTSYRGTGFSVALVAGVLLAIVVIVLALQNTENTTVEVLAGDYRAPLVVVILIATVAGVLLDEIVGLVWRHRRRRRLADRAELRQLRRQQH